MAVNSEIGARMKEFYETVPKINLMRRTPVIIRIDGKSFHTFTRGFDKPFDKVLMSAMQFTMKYLCEHIQGCVLGYTQSDEISLLLVDYAKLETCAWFDNEVQKICSISASMATMWFNWIFKYLSDTFISTEEEKFYREKFNRTRNEITTEELKSIDPDCKLYRLIRAYDKASYRAVFDARCFNIPKEEVTNYFYWRQLDAIRNSIESVGHANFSDKELHKKSSNMIKEMLLEEKGINYDELSAAEKWGTCCIKGDKHKSNKDSSIPEGPISEASKWFIDHQIPIWKGNDRSYIDKLVLVGS